MMTLQKAMQIRAAVDAAYDKAREAAVGKSGEAYIDALFAMDFPSTPEEREEAEQVYWAARRAGVQGEELEDPFISEEECIRAAEVEGAE